MSYKTLSGAISATAGKAAPKFLTGRIDPKKLMKIGKINNNPEENKYMNDTVSTKPVEYMSAEETEKTAGFGDRFLTGMGMALGAGVLSGVGTLASNMATNFLDNRKYEQNLKIAIQMTPTLQRYPYETIKSYLPMIAKASPTVASDPRLLANYLESMLDAEGHLNLATFRELASLEGNVLQNDMLQHPYRTELLKGITGGIGKSIGKMGANFDQ